MTGNQVYNVAACGVLGITAACSASLSPSSGKATGTPNRHSRRCFHLRAAPGPWRALW